MRTSLGKNTTDESYPDGESVDKKTGNLKDLYKIALNYLRLKIKLNQLL